MEVYLLNRNTLCSQEKPCVRCCEGAVSFATAATAADSPLRWPWPVPKVGLKKICVREEVLHMLSARKRNP
jgi:hypothetical protein